MELFSYDPMQANTEKEKEDKLFKYQTNIIEFTLLVAAIDYNEDNMYVGILLRLLFRMHDQYFEYRLKDLHIYSNKYNFF